MIKFVHKTFGKFNFDFESGGALLKGARLKGGEMLQVRRTAICGSVFAVVLLCGTLAYGQNTAGTILGAVSDESGARLPGVTVTITHLDTGIVRSVTTDEGGRYRAPAWVWATTT